MARTGPAKVGRSAIRCTKHPLRAQRQKAALKEREDLSRQIFQHSHDAIFILDPFEDRLLYVNPSACAMLEYEREELLGTPVSAIHPNEMPRFKEFAQEIFKNGGGWTDQLTYTTKSGRHIPAEISGSVVVRDGQRRMLAIVGDISVRRQREDPRLESVRRQHELILDAVGDGLLGYRNGRTDHVHQPCRCGDPRRHR